MSPPAGTRMKTIKGPSIALFCKQAQKLFLALLPKSTSPKTDEIANTRANAKSLASKTGTEKHMDSFPTERLWASLDHRSPLQCKVTASLRHCSRAPCSLKPPATSHPTTGRQRRASQHTAPSGRPATEGTMGRVIG